MANKVCQLFGTDHICGSSQNCILYMEVSVRMHTNFNFCQVC